MTPNELDEKAKQYIESLTDDYFENTPKYKLVKNAFVTGVFFAESCEKTIEKLEKEIAGLKLQLAISEHDREHNDYELTETYKTIAELKEKLDKINAIVYKTEHKFIDFEKIKAIIMG